MLLTVLLRVCCPPGRVVRFAGVTVRMCISLLCLGRYMRHIPSTATVGVTRNTALKENIFAIVVCIQTHMPVIIVGPPGSTKTLSFQIVRESVLVEPMVRPGGET